MHISDYWRKIPLLMLHLHILIYNFLMVSVDTWLNENSLLLLNFFLIASILQWKAIFLIMKSIVSFLDDVGVSLSQIKRFNGPVIDLECLLKIAVTTWFYPFQVTLYILVYYYFYLRCTVYMLSKIIWNYNQH